MCRPKACGLPEVDVRHPVHVTGDRAIDRYTIRTTRLGHVVDGYLRLVRIDHRWLLLDVPGQADPCLDRALAAHGDPFSCPVLRH